MYAITKLDCYIYIYYMYTHVQHNPVTELHAPPPCSGSSRQMLSDGTCFVLEVSDEWMIFAPSKIFQATPLAHVT